MTDTEPKVEMRHVVFGGSLKAFLTALANDLADKSNMIVVPLGGPLAAELATIPDTNQPVLIVTFDVAAANEADRNDN